MFLRHFLLLLLFAAFSYSGLYSQQYFYNDRYYENSWLLETGVGFGLMNCLTDLGGKKDGGQPFLRDLILRNAKPSIGLSLSVTYHYQLGLRVSYTRGSLWGSDHEIASSGTAPGIRRKRNLHFKTSLSEWSLLAELYPMEIRFSDEARPLIWDILSPYLLFGIGFFTFDPRAEWNHQWIRLQPLRTEGQGFPEYGNHPPYKLSQPNIPIGAGCRIELSAICILRIEWLNRILFTDYLDDVSRNYIDPAYFDKYLDPINSLLSKKLADRTGEIDPTIIHSPGSRRGNAEKNDTYFSADLKLSIILNRKRRL